MLFAFIYLNYGVQEMHVIETKFYDNIKSAIAASTKVAKKLSRTGSDDATLIVVSIKNILKYSIFVEFDGGDGALPILEIKGAKKIHISSFFSE